MQNNFSFKNLFGSWFQKAPPKVSQGLHIHRVLSDNPHTTKWNALISMHKADVWPELTEALKKPASEDQLDKLERMEFRHVGHSDESGENIFSITENYIGPYAYIIGTAEKIIDMSSLDATQKVKAKVQAQAFKDEGFYVIAVAEGSVEDVETYYLDHFRNVNFSGLIVLSYV